MRKILIIEDNNEINHMLCDWFSQNNFEVKSAFSGTEGLLYYQTGDFDIIILDLMLPGLSGEEVLRKIRLMSQIPVIVASAKTNIHEKVRLLENGADDYVTKPFDLRELLARVKIQCSKSIPCKTIAEGDSKLIYNGLIIDKQLRTVTIEGKELSLTRQEYEIVYRLFSNPLKIFTKEELFYLAWNDYYKGADKTMNVHISNIRNKIKQITDKSYIDTVWGIGYRACREES